MAANCRRTVLAARLDGRAAAAQLERLLHELKRLPSATMHARVFAGEGGRARGVRRWWTSSRFSRAYGPTLTDLGFVVVSGPQKPKKARVRGVQVVLAGVAQHQLGRARTQRCNLGLGCGVQRLCCRGGKTRRGGAQVGCQHRKHREPPAGSGG